MINASFLKSRAQVQSFIGERILAVVTEYTIYKMDLELDRVVFRCLQGENTFHILFQSIQEELNANFRDFSEAFLETIISYCAVVSQENGRLTYPVCEFSTWDDLLDWYAIWLTYPEPERLKYLESL